MKQSLYLNWSHWDDESYTKRLLAEQCMPVLLQIKPANSITVYKRKLKNQSEFLEYLNRIITFFNCKLMILYENETMLFLILYQPNRLNDFLSKYQNWLFLSAYGYCLEEDNLVSNTLRCLEQRYLKYREQGSEFPHEMGIILGYPTEDVAGFIINKGKNHLYQGYWKVYGDVEKAKKMFQQIHQAREIGEIFFGSAPIDILH